MRSTVHVTKARAGHDESQPITFCAPLQPLRAKAAAEPSLQPQGKSAVTQARLAAARAAATGRPRYAAIAFPMFRSVPAAHDPVASRMAWQIVACNDSMERSTGRCSPCRPQQATPVSRWRSSPHLKAKRRNVSETRGQRFGGCEWTAARRRRRAARAVSAGQVGAAYRRSARSQQRDTAAPARRKAARHEDSEVATATKLRRLRDDAGAKVSAAEGPSAWTSRSSVQPCSLRGSAASDRESRPVFHQGVLEFPHENTLNLLPKCPFCHYPELTLC